MLEIFPGMLYIDFIFFLKKRKKLRLSFIDGATIKKQKNVKNSIMADAKEIWIGKKFQSQYWIIFSIFWCKNPLANIELCMDNILDPASIGSIFNPILYLTVSKVKMNVPIVVLKKVQLGICVFYPEPKDHAWICYQSGKISFFFL